MSNTYIIIGASDYKYDNIGRNDQCPCGSGKKFKKCCLLKCEDKGE